MRAVVYDLSGGFCDSDLIFVISKKINGLGDLSKGIILIQIIRKVFCQHYREFLRNNGPDCNCRFTGSIEGH